MAISRIEPPELDAAFAALMQRLERGEGNQALRTEAAKLAHSMRGRLTELASIKADHLPENTKRVEQAEQLVSVAGDAADPLLLSEFGPVRSAVFTYHPGIASGYAGYTDHHAIRNDLNDWLLVLSDERQTWLVGFGYGLVHKIVERYKDAGAANQNLHLFVSSRDKDITDAVDWLNRLQLSGTDNAPPSTLNLLGALEDVHARMARRGPIRAKYWSAVRHAQEEQIESQTSDVIPDACLGALNAAKARGTHLATELVMTLGTAETEYGIPRNAENDRPATGAGTVSTSKTLLAVVAFVLIIFLGWAFLNHQWQADADRNYQRFDQWMNQVEQRDQERANDALRQEPAKE